MDFAGKKIKEIRKMTKQELDDEGWDDLGHGDVLVIVLENGSWLYASQDEEGNGPGCLYGKMADGTSVYVQAEKEPRSVNVTQFEQMVMDAIEKHRGPDRKLKGVSPLVVATDLKPNWKTDDPTFPTTILCNIKSLIRRKVLHMHMVPKKKE